MPRTACRAPLVYLWWAIRRRPSVWARAAASTSATPQAIRRSSRRPRRCSSTRASAPTSGRSGTSSRAPSSQRPDRSFPSKPGTRPGSKLVPGPDGADRRAVPAQALEPTAGQALPTVRWRSNELQRFPTGRRASLGSVEMPRCVALVSRPGDAVRGYQGADGSWPSLSSQPPSAATIASKAAAGRGIGE